MAKLDQGTFQMLLTLRFKDCDGGDMYFRYRCASSLVIASSAAILGVAPDMAFK